MDKRPSSLRSFSPFWTTDEDGERVHRLQREWDGNKGAWRNWYGYDGEHDQWDLSVGATWSRWALGVETDVSHSSAWDRERDCRADYRRVGVTLSLGPWYLAWFRCSPLRRGSSS